MFDYRAIHVALLLWACLFSLIAAVCTAINTSFEPTKRRWLLAMQLSGAVLMGCDALAWAYRGDSGEVGCWMVRVSNFLVFFASDLILLLFHGYVCCYLFEKNAQARASPQAHCGGGCHRCSGHGARGGEPVHSPVLHLRRAELLPPHGVTPHLPSRPYGGDDAGRKLSGAVPEKSEPSALPRHALLHRTAVCGGHRAAVHLRHFAGEHRGGYLAHSHFHLLAGGAESENGRAGRGTGREPGGHHAPADTAPLPLQRADHHQISLRYTGLSCGR